MSDGQGHGGGKKPTDDRTLLDPLSSDELKALREARQRMQQKKGSPVAHQIVIGPDTGEDIGDAPTRAMPALPSFEGNVSIDQIGTNPPAPSPHMPQDPANRSVGGPPSEPMSVHGQRPAASLPPTPSVGAPHPTQPGQPGQPGFGENTLLWMQPPKPPPGVQVGAGAGAPTPDVMPKTSAAEQAKSKVKAVLAMLVFVGIGAALLVSVLMPQARGTLELHTNPPKATVYINGKASEETTPVKLTLHEGDYTIEVELEGYAKETINTRIAGDEASRKDIELTPVSKPGFLTVSVQVQPVAANIVFDGKSHTGRSFKVANIDPSKPHKISVEAGGYVKVAQDIAAGELKPEYSFVLQKDDTVPQ